MTIILDDVAVDAAPALDAGFRAFSESYAATSQLQAEAVPPSRIPTHEEVLARVDALIPGCGSGRRKRNASGAPPRARWLS
jgi:hypothetical protein